jgi:hypothetical protein
LIWKKGFQPAIEKKCPKFCCSGTWYWVKNYSLNIFKALLDYKLVKLLVNMAAPCMKGYATNTKQGFESTNTL